MLFGAAQGPDVGIHAQRFLDCELPGSSDATQKRLFSCAELWHDTQRPGLHPDACLIPLESGGKYFLFGYRAIGDCIHTEKDTTRAKKDNFQQ